MPLSYVTMLLVLLHAFITVPQTNPGTDFTPIFTAAHKYVAGQPVFDSDYTIDMPHYLYTPAGTVLIAPVAVFNDEHLARNVFAVLGALCIIAALAMATRMLTHRWFHVVFPLATSAFFITGEPVRTTLALTNINGFMLLLMVVFVWCSLALRHGAEGWRSWTAHFTRPEAYIAGITAAVAFSIKPQFGVLFIVSLALGQIAVPVIAGVVSVALFAFGWVTIAQPQLFFTNLVPYLGEPRPRFNGSVAGLGIVFNWPGWLVTALTVGLILGTLVAVVTLWRWKDVDEVMWAFTTLGVCFAGGFMASGLLQNYYAIWLLPMMLTVIRPRSPMHWPVLWAIFLIMLGNPNWPETSSATFNVFAAYLPPFMFLAVPFVVTVWGLSARPSAGRPSETVSPERHAR